MLKKIPLDITIQITHKCESNCKYCKLPENGINDELTTKQYKKIINDLSEMGTINLTFTGGEPLLRNDITKLVKYAANKNIPYININTNGNNVKKLIEIKKYLKNVYFSLDGDKETNNFLRGQDSYEKTKKVISKMDKDLTNITILATLNKLNYSNFNKQLKHMIKLSKNMNSYLLYHPLYKHKWNKDQIEELKLNKEELLRSINILERINKSEKIFRRNTEEYKIWKEWIKTSNNPLKTYAGQYYAWIYPDGMISPCHFGRDECYDVKKHGFKKAFKKICPEDHVHDLDCMVYSTTRDILFRPTVNSIKNLVKRGLIRWI